MRRNQQRLLGLGVSILAALIMSPALLGQASPDSKAAAPVLTDWSHHHVIFSRPATAEQAKRVEQEPRYSQQLRRHSLAKLPGGKTGDALLPSLQPLSKTLPGKTQGLIRDWSEDMGTGATVGAGNYPAKFSFTATTASCANDFVVYSTGLLGSTGRADIVAYNNLYSGCTGPVPAVYWAYNTHATIRTSPVFSLDGTQIAAVQTNTLPQAILTLVKWAASTTESLSSPVTLNFVSRTAYTTCTPPCRTTIPLTAAGNPVTDTNSSVFYNYSGDTAYVGDDSGFLHKFNPVFKGVLAEVTTGGWPVQVNPTTPTPLTSPVFDSASGDVFVADKGGFLYFVDSAATVVQSGQVDFSDANDGGPGIVEGPIVDSTAGFVYVFSTSDGIGGCAGGADCAAVFRFGNGFSPGDVPPRAIVGASTVAPATPSPLYIGAFDSTYESSRSATGNLYVCGNTGGPPILYQVALTDITIGTVSAGPVLSASATTPCSPVTDVLNPTASGGPTEWVFASAQTDGSARACASGGCVFNFKDTPWKPSTAYTVGQEVLDDHFQIQVVSVAGTSGTAAPTWSTSVDGLTHDGTTLIWVDQGVQSAFTPGSWAANSVFSVGTLILDSNGNIERCIASVGPSGGSVPDWFTTPGLVTPDFDVFWENLGAPATAAMAAAGGTSGIIIDNTVGSGTLPGASQVYFSTLSNQICGTSVTTGGCAVQASQSALK
jgi:hypothetical protein